MSSQGPNSCSTGTGASWTNPSNITGAGSFATYGVAKPNVVTTGTLAGTVFGFSIPAGATINGIVASFVRKQNLNNGTLTNTNSIQLLKAGIAAGSTKSDATDWTTSGVSESYGTSSDLWGTTWTAAQINASGFGFQITVNVDTSGSPTNIVISANNFLVTVYYTVGISKAVCSQIIGF